MPSQWAPPGESAEDLWFERSNLDGLILSGVAYGVLLTLFFQCMQIQLSRPKTSRMKWVWTAYTCALFILGTLGFAGNTKFTEMTFIDDRNYPGGPNGFTKEQYGSPINMMDFASYTVMSWVADGFLLFRFLILSNFNYLLTLFPALMFLGSVTMSIALMIAISNSTDTFWNNASVKFGIAYWSFSISLNIVITIFITFQILRVKSRVKNTLGPQAAAMYTSLSAILIESAALYSIWGLVFIVSYARGSPFLNIVLPPLGEVQGIAPLLIILRASNGRAWTQDIATRSTRPRTFTSTLDGGATAITLNQMKNGHQQSGVKSGVTVSKSVVSDAEHEHIETHGSDPESAYDKQPYISHSESETRTVV